MRGRKFIDILLLTVAIGSIVTLCTGFLTGSLNRLGQVTVTLAGGLESSAGAVEEETPQPTEPMPQSTAAVRTGPGAMTGGTNAYDGPETVSEEGASDVSKNAFLTQVDGSASADAEMADESVSPINTGPEMLPSDDGATDGGAPMEKNPYYIRLTELDAQIQKNRDIQNASNAAGGAGSNSLARNTVDNELKLWELSTIYNAILKKLDEKQTRELVTAERQWVKNRDAAAIEAAKNSAGGSLESVEYTSSLAETTRARAYELISQYGYLLTD